MPGSRDVLAEELRERLRDFDRATKLLYPGHVFQLVVVGGGALALLGCISRPTSDIDVIVFPPKLVDLMERFDISGRVKAYEDEFAGSFRDRLVPLDLGTRAVECYAVSLEDLVISKLHSAREVDAMDIREPEVLRILDWDRLDAIAAEMEEQRYFERRYQEFKISFEQYREECRPCGS